MKQLRNGFRDTYWQETGLDTAKNLASILSDGKNGGMMENCGYAVAA